MEGSAANKETPDYACSLRGRPVFLTVYLSFLLLGEYVGPPNNVDNWTQSG